MIRQTLRWFNVSKKHPKENGRYFVRLTDDRADVREFIKPDRWGGDVVWWARIPKFRA